MKTANDTFDLLSKLLSEKSTNQTEQEKFLEKIYSIVTEELSTIVEKSSFPQKSKLVGQLQETLDDITIFSQFPELIGKTVVGIFGTKGKLDRELLDFLSNGNDEKIYEYNNSIPTIIYKSNEVNHIRAINQIENIFSVSEKDFKDTNNELYKWDLDIRQFLYAFSISAHIPYENITFIHFPYYAIKSREYYRRLMDLVDICILPVDKGGNWKKTFELLKKYGKKHIVFVISNDQQKDMEQFVEIKSSCACFYIDEELHQFLHSINKSYNNIAFSERFLSILSEFYLFQRKKIKEQTGFVKGMNEDLVNIEDENTQNSLKEMRQQLNARLKEEKELYQSFQSIVEDLLKHINYLEESIITASSKKVDKDGDLNQYRPLFEEMVLKVILNMIESEELTIANTYIERWTSMGFEHGFIFDLLKRKMAGKKPLISQLKNLAQLKDENHLVLKAKVLFGEILQLNIDEIASMAKKLPKPRTAYENYVIGLDFENKGNIEKAKHYYHLALDLGCVEAGNALMKMNVDLSFKELEHLANKLIPEANYLVGIRSLEAKKYAKGITYLKIAAVYEHIGAIRKLADIEFGNVEKKIRYRKAKNKKSMNIAIELYNFLMSKGVNDKESLENLGKLYYWSNNYRNAIQLLDQCDTAEAKFLCGTIFQYGKGVAQDLSKAKEILKKAADLGHKQAAVEYEKVCGWIEANNSKEKYDSTKSYATTYTSSYSGSKRGCFLTTATCLSLGKEDDCEEIIAFKKYRDQYLINDEDGPGLIREYYRIAPEILKKISDKGNEKEVFQQLYDRFIAVGYQFLLQENYVKAKETYIQMVEYLCNTYNVKTKYQ